MIGPDDSEDDEDAGSGGGAGGGSGTSDVSPETGGGTSFDTAGNTGLSTNTGDEETVSTATATSGDSVRSAATASGEQAAVTTSGSAGISPTKEVSASEWESQQKVAMMHRSEQGDIPALMRPRTVPTIGDLEPGVSFEPMDTESLNFFERCVHWWRGLIERIRLWFRRG